MTCDVENNLDILGVKGEGRCGCHLIYDGFGCLNAPEQI